MPAFTDNTARHRFEMIVGGNAAFVDYAMRNGQLVLINTEVPHALEGRGVGSALVRSVLTEARSRGLHIVPECSFVQGYLRRNPEFADLVAASSKPQS